ncbi:hypothetical protein [Bordetella tumulicola]|uniref:hypothetical protein n=1 Tax=Bordetella tumulicola TaxID=1649133 RepID=UPI0039F13301
MKTRFAIGSLALIVLGARAAWAAPSPDDQAKAAEAKAKAAWTTKVTAYKLCASQDKVVEQYRARLTADGKTAPEPVATPACTDPGPFAYAPEASTQSREDSGAHSPAETAKQPPSSAQPESAGKQQPK